MAHGTGIQFITHTESGAIERQEFVGVDALGIQVFGGHKGVNGANIGIESGV